MANNAQSETALLTEHFQYTPLTLMDEIIDTINDLSSRAVDAAEKGLLQASPSDLGFVDKAKAEKQSLEKDERGRYLLPAEAELELREGVHQLETLLQANIDINFDKFEIVSLRSILHVPEELLPWVRLEHYRDIPQSYRDTHTMDPQAVLELRQRLRATKKLNKALDAAVKRNNAVISAIKSLTAPAVEGQSSAGPVAFLTNDVAADELGVSSMATGDSGAGPLETNLAFALSHLPALKQLVEELRPQLAELSQLADQPAPDGDIARERRAHVETQSRRALARQGLATDSGALDTLGKVVSIDELAALEAIAGDIRNG